MHKYPKITTVFDRDPETDYSTLLFGQYAKPEFEYLAECGWVFREKIHGTNLRLIWDPKATPTPVLKGRRESSQVPDFLIDDILLRDPSYLTNALQDQFGDTPACLYGEGFGPKMQSVGEKYRSERHEFCLFDVKIGKWWLQEEDVTEIAGNLGFARAPIVGRGTLDEAVEIVRDGFTSSVAVEPLMAEGLIMHPAVDLHDRSGSRIMTKLKYEDFEGNSIMEVENV